MQATLKDIGADTVVAEFQTDQNKWSVWKIENDEDLNDAFIALAANCEHICTISAVKMDHVNLPTIEFDDEIGMTPTMGINDKHRNMINLNYVSLGEVISSIICGLQNQGYIRKTKGMMKTILADAYDKDKLDMEKIKPSLKEEIMDAVEKTRTKNA